MRSALVLAGLTMTLAGCFLFGPTVRNPTVVGVIETSDNSTGVWELIFEDGRTFEFDAQASTGLEGSSGGVSPGTLFFYGDGDEPWNFNLTEITEGSGCFWWNEAATDDDTHINFDNGLRLPKAPDFDGQGWPQDGRYDDPVPGGDVAPFCMNAEGEVTQYRGR